MKAIAIVVLVLVAALGACGKNQEPAPTPVVVPPPVAPPGVAPPVAGPPQAQRLPQVAPVAPAALTVLPQPPAFEWTATPSLDKIPAAPAGGMLNGAPFPVAAVVFEPGASAWRLVLGDTSLESPTAVSINGQFASIDLAEPLAAGKTYSRPMAAGGGYFQVAPNPADRQTTVAWNTDNAWVLELTKWDAREYDPKGELFQDAGRASGRVAICFKGAGAYQNSWVAGTFENAIVRYLGKPPWVAAKPEPKSTGGRATGGGGGGGAAAKAKDALDKAKGEATKPGVAPETKPAIQPTFRPIHPSAPAAPAKTKKK
jgi:hypothetical protein